MLRIAILLSCCLCLAAAPHARAGELWVVIHGLESNAGNVQVEVFGAEQRATFPYAERGVVAEVRIEARALRERGAAVTLGELAPGSYAVAVIHDANGNGEMDLNFLGLPQESYGFSNGAKPTLGPPSFDAAAVSVGPEGVTRADVQLSR